MDFALGTLSDSVLGITFKSVTWLKYTSTVFKRMCFSPIAQCAVLIHECLMAATLGVKMCSNGWYTYGMCLRTNVCVNTCTILVCIFWTPKWQTGDACQVSCALCNGSIPIESIICYNCSLMHTTDYAIGIVYTNLWACCVLWCDLSFYMRKWSWRIALGHRLC